jgi:hypothetical protein
MVGEATYANPYMQAMGAAGMPQGIGGATATDMVQKGFQDYFTNPDLQNAVAAGTPATASQAQSTAQEAIGDDTLKTVGDVTNVAGAVSKVSGGGQQQQPAQPTAPKVPSTRQAPASQAQGATPLGQPTITQVPEWNWQGNVPSYGIPTAGQPQHMAGPPSPWGHPLTGQLPGVMDTLRMLGGRLGIQMQPNPPGIYQQGW